jgi:hypothetical protein
MARLRERNLFKDNMTNSIHNLDESAYDFTTELGTFKDRLSCVTLIKLLKRIILKHPKHSFNF